jgi:peptide/nickel transport system substrate-binding protein
MNTGKTYPPPEQSIPSIAMQVASLVLLLVVVVVLGGCKTSDSGAIRFGLASAPITLHPLHATDATSSRINRLIYRRLVDFDDNSMPVASLASWEQMSATAYRFYLGSEGREFHDGTRLDAEDVVATYRYVLDERNASAQRASIATIETIIALNKNTVDVSISKPDPLFPGYMVLGIVPQEAILRGHDLAREPVGSGAFRFLSWAAEGSVQLQRIGDDQLIDFVPVRDSTVRVLKLLNKELDLLQNDLSPELLNYLRAQESVSVRTAHGSKFSYVGFNLEDDVTGQLAVRQAIAHAIDRDAIVTHVFGGSARLANAMFPADHWAGNPDLKSLRYDPQRSRQLLGEAGYGPDNPLSMVYKTSSDPFRLRLATIIQNQLAEVGIAVSLRSYDWGTFYSDIKSGMFQMYSLAWVGIKTPDIFRYVFHSDAIPPKGANRGRLRDARVDKLIEDAESQVLLVRQAIHYRTLQSRLLDVMPYVPLWYEDNYTVIRDGFSGYSLALDGNYDGLISVQREPVTTHGS